MADLRDRFPDLFFDHKVEVVDTPKPELPSMAQVMAKVLVANGIQNNSLAAELGSAAESLVSLRSPVKP